MQNITSMIKKSLETLLFKAAVAADGPPSWIWIYEPAKPTYLKNK